MKQRTARPEHARYGQGLRLRYSFRMILALWRHWHEVRHAEAELRALDARELGDIGLTAGSIPAVARGIFLEAGARGAVKHATAQAAD